MVVGVHLDQGFCVRFQADGDGYAPETWEEWSESDFLGRDGAITSIGELPAAVLAEAQEVLDEAEDGTHLHLHETD